MIVAEHLSHSYGDIRAVDDVSFIVHQGELFGLIGPDGAGKTTLFRILTSLVIPDSGKARVASLSVVDDYVELRKLLGYMPGRFSLYQDLSVEENLELFATLFGTTVKRNYDIIKDIYVQLEPFRKRKAGKLSGGMKQKLALCCALVHRPRVLFLDEPTTGVDPVSRKEFWEMLNRLKLQGITIMVSTPYMDEAVLCDRIAFIKDGKILEIDKPENMVSGFSDSLLAVRCDRMHRVKAALAGTEGVEDIYSFGEFFHIRTSADAVTVRENIENRLSAEGFTGITVKSIAPTIEDCFISKLASRNDDRG